MKMRKWYRHRVMYNDAVEYSHYAITHGLVDGEIYIVDCVDSLSGKNYELINMHGLFDKKWFLEVYYSTKMPLKGKELQIANYEGENTIITPSNIVKTETHSNVYKVYVGDDFYVVMYMR